MQVKSSDKIRGKASPQHLVLYAKHPLPGYAKTRLGAAIGTEQSAGVYARLLYAYLLDLAKAHLPGTTIELSLASASDIAFFAGAFPEFTVQPQVEGDLGQRMAASFAQAFSRGASSVILTGSDVPDLTSQLVRDAFQALESNPIVIGPAADGGYYLVGMHAPGARLFEGIAWSSKHVLAQTQDLARAQKLEIAYLPELYDMDTIREYERWQGILLEQEKGADNE
ncbi:MAG: TIGR04282 family arsenosugar biosynthesis glycosyltransferase [Anaerolineae bacterium]|nr:TIGR04282 family arsenosugar biosynthesis glycosyltransferase [Anaerolineae bacterium]